MLQVVVLVQVGFIASLHTCGVRLAMACHACRFFVLFGFTPEPGSDEGVYDTACDEADRDESSDENDASRFVTVVTATLQHHAVLPGIHTFCVVTSCICLLDVATSTDDEKQQ